MVKWNQQMLHERGGSTKDGFWKKYGIFTVIYEAKLENGRQIDPGHNDFSTLDAHGQKCI